MKFKMEKVFDCQDMPEDVQKAFFEYTEDKSNDVYIDWCSEPLIKNPKEEFEIHCNAIQKWLLQNGLNKKEDCIIKRWW